MILSHIKSLLTLFLLLSAVTLQAGKKQHVISSVKEVNIVTPAGTAPRLPWQVWVTYADGSSEWRQVRWTNSTTALEEQEADKEKTPAGTSYTVRGFILGDNTTKNGYPVDAKISVSTTAWEVPSATPTAEPLPLQDVMLTGDNLLTHNRDLDISNLLALDVTQQLYNYRDTYGLPTEGYTVSDGWDSPTTKLKGHGTGHYLSALALAFAGTKDESLRRELRQRIQRMVDEMRECQERTFVWDESLGRYREARDLAPEQELSSMQGTWDAFNQYKQDYQHYGYGYLNAIPAQHCALIEMYRAYNNEEWVWAPYYTVHKQLAGLIDIAQYIDSPEIAKKALLIARDMGLWVWNRLHYRTYVKTDGTREERRQRPGNRYEMWNMYIAGEVGGMAESLSRLAEMSSGDDRQRLIEAASFFDAPAFFNPVARNIDNIRTRHANQHIPMIVGALRSYRTNSNPFYYNLSLNFWDMMQGRYTYAMGGVGNGEMWRQPYSQMTSMNTNIMSDGMGHRMPNPDLNETCCAYNLAKLTKELNCFHPDDARYMDYYERVLYNQIIGSLNPDEYGVCYQYAVGLDAQKPFGNVTPQESCCGGTGAENHVRYQEAAYFVGNDTLWVALYMPTTAEWRSKGVTIHQDCTWPAEKSTIKVNGGTFAMRLRVPYWADGRFDIRLNGRSVAHHYMPCSYVEIPCREWKDTDEIQVIMPFTKHISYGPDKMDMAFSADEGGTMKPFAPRWLGALMFGPLVMTSPDIHTWQEAELTLKPDLSDISATHDASGYSLTAGGCHFLPDYAVTEQTSTHYLRLDIPSTAKRKQTTTALDTSTLEQMIASADERVRDQEAWMALERKVPEYAPWASNGYQRMLQSCSQAQQALTDKSLSQSDIDYIASSLNVAIISMRPGNLAEPEDLTTLLQLIEDCREHGARTPERREALDFARMVVQYVNDGSGTRDMIRKAEEKLKSE